MVRTLLLATALLAIPSLAAARTASPIEGQWTNPARSVTVRIAPCGETLCGRVTTASAHARAKAAAAGTPRLVGTELMSALAPKGAGAWHGIFFVPDHNIRAPGDLRLTGPRTIEIEGCAIPGLLCKSQQWTRVAPAARARRHR